MTEASKILVEKAYNLDEIRKSLEDAAALSGGVWFSYLFVFFYIGSAVLGVTQVDLLLEKPVKLPFLNTELPIVTFFFLAPILFAISHVYTLMHFAMLATKARRFDDELTGELRGKVDAENLKDRVRWLLPSNIFVQFLAGPEYIRKGVLEPLLQLIAWITLVISPILLLLMIQMQFLPYHNERITMVHRYVIFFDVGMWFILWPIVLGGRSETKWPVWWKKWAWLPSLVPILLSIAIITFPGEVLDKLFASWMPFHHLFFDGQVDPVSRNRSSLFTNAFVLPDFDAVNAAKIDDPKKLDSVKETLSLRGRHLESAHFDRADLRKADLEGAQLQGASLNDAQLQGASLSGAELAGASLRYAQLQGASLNGAGLQGTDLFEANLQGASLEEAALQGVWLVGAQLEGARLINAQLQGAWLLNADLRGAELLGANLRGASLQEADLQGASLAAADLRGADFAKSTFFGSTMENAKLWRTNFEKAVLTAVFEDELIEYSISSEQFADLKLAIRQEVPEGKKRERALQRIEKLNPDKFGPEESVREALEQGRVDKAAYQKALVARLLPIACSGDGSAVYIVRNFSGAAFRYYPVSSRRRFEILTPDGLLTNGVGVRTISVRSFGGTNPFVDAGPFASALIESILAPDCPVSAALAEQDKANLRKLAKKAQPNESKQ
ncbi:MAG: pentapeptide repeat-containing protein [Methylocella sp.]